VAVSKGGVRHDVNHTGLDHFPGRVPAGRSAGIIDAVASQVVLGMIQERHPTASATGRSWKSSTSGIALRVDRAIRTGGVEVPSRAQAALDGSRSTTLCLWRRTRNGLGRTVSTSGALATHKLQRRQPGAHQSSSRQMRSARNQGNWVSMIFSVLRKSPQEWLQDSG